MASSPRGVILIIDNEHFDDDGVDDREGTEEDCRMLCELFGEYLGFQVIVCKNLTGKASVYIVKRVPLKHCCRHSVDIQHFPM